MADGRQGGLSEGEQQDADELAAPRSRVIYDVVRRQGEEELDRPPGSLFWSGLAGGVAMMASVIGEGALRAKIPASVPGREALADIGYALGFLIVILGRMQLFTEQTIVAVLPNLAEPGWRKAIVTARLWAIVFGANMAGTFVAALFNVQLHMVGRPLLDGMLEVSDALLAKSPPGLLLQGIPAGFLIASVAWIRAGINNGEFWMVLAVTSAIALGDFTHVVAGAAETFLLLLAGKVGLGHALFGMILPALAGNVIGGSGLFALLAHAQVREEL